MHSSDGVNVGFSKSLLNVQGGTVKACASLHPGHQNQYCDPALSLVLNLCSAIFGMNYLSFDF